jgi:hypothetical protein
VSLGKTELFRPLIKAVFFIGGQQMKAEATGKELKEAAAWLSKENCGCWHKCLLIDDDGKEWSIVMGWSEGFEECQDDPYSDGTYHICAKIAYHERNNIMSCDFDIDFTMPFDTDNGEIYDTCRTVFRDTDWNKLAEELTKEFTDVTGMFAYFEPFEEEIA